MVISKGSKKMLLTLVLISVGAYFIFRKEDKHIIIKPEVTECRPDSLENIRVVISKVNKEQLSKGYLYIIKDSLNNVLYSQKDSFAQISHTSDQYRVLCNIPKSFSRNSNIEIQSDAGAFLLTDFEFTPKPVRTGISSSGLDGCILNKLKINNKLFFYRDDMVIIDL